MARLGVLTFHRCINYGSFWQARCLVHGLRSLGADPVILDHRSARVSRAELRCALRPLLPARTAPADIPLYASKARKFLSALASLPLSAPFALDDPAGLEDCDIVVIGSDEVWNLRHPWYGGYPLFYGEGLRARSLVSYAATFGNHSAASGLDHFWAERLSKFDEISVRDENSRRIVEKAVRREAALVLDPCLQFPETIVSCRHTASRPYVAVYGHSFPAWFQKAICRWAAARSLPLVSIGYRNEWADEQWLDAGPYEFAGCIAGAEAVVTNFFHGCVFALLNTKPFACVLSDYRSNKIVDLTQLVGAEPHVMAPGTSQAEYEAILDEAPGRAIAERLAQLRAQSRTYLINVLN
ncbi:polysaccharide pyruvyl transferase family protein [Sinorhizobium saheli]|uniref:Polysaccharide pyruvyl transferase n=1 Tax=Sinorhizobium saheli TaxID=36856 RepID=A0A178YUA3_SINSA|nr:polysaccharide pyruvyl transferase family protein [Sinorhizobium saheli]MQW88306.1 polysaccharide pyruvyl transferase family protein [Sinorhizobium saheli]OAP50433.1 polysaccharide pyruvyl transferase [Sinorhizobium saheli]